MLFALLESYFSELRASPRSTSGQLGLQMHDKPKKISFGYQWYSETVSSNIFYSCGIKTLY